MSQNALITVASHLIALGSGELQHICINALKASITLDLESLPPSPASPEQISEEFGINLRLMHQLGICITKRDVYDFLNSLGIPSSRYRISRKITRHAYESFFDRNISCIGKKPCVFTYAEVLHFEEIKIQLELPASLLQIVAEIEHELEI